MRQLTGKKTGKMQSGFLHEKSVINCKPLPVRVVINIFIKKPGNLKNICKISVMTSSDRRQLCFFFFWISNENGDRKFLKKSYKRKLKSAKSFFLRELKDENAVINALCHQFKTFSSLSTRTTMNSTNNKFDDGDVNNFREHKQYKPKFSTTVIICFGHYLI